MKCKHLPKVCMGSGALPPRVAKHVPKVQMGTGDLPPRVVKHIPKVQMGTGALPPRVIKHVPKVHMGSGYSPRVTKHVPKVHMGIGLPSTPCYQARAKGPHGIGLPSTPCYQARKVRQDQTMRPEKDSVEEYRHVSSGVHGRYTSFASRQGCPRHPPYRRLSVL